MPQTFYIENDEEIISVIGRLRKSSSQENFFVFPKRALVLQSIVNLRLFQREAEKLGKKIVIVTQDEAGKKLAEKAGVETESYSDDFNSKNAHMELTPVASPEKKVSQTSPQPGIPRSQDIGSMDFFAPQAGGVSSRVAPAPVSPVKENGEPMTLRIRNASPEKQTSLNSMRGGGEQMGIRKTVPPAFNPTVSLGNYGNPRETQMSSPVNTPSFAAPSRPQAQGMSQGASREERLKNFFAPQSTPVSPQASRPMPVSAPKKVAPVSEAPVISKKVSHIFLILGGVSLVSLLGVGLFLFLPKAEVHIVPRKLVRSVDKQFDGRVTGDMSEENVVPVRVVEREQNVMLSLTATGTAQGSAQKARGNVTIYNEFGTEPQTLVATTRFESADGKIFRLIEGVTVPGMTNSTPGSITAAVIADQTGSDYNIPPTNFTIPGFKGSAKYSKFSAKSSKAMSGGGDATGSDITVISKSDVDNAEIKAKEKAKEDYLNAVKNELKAEERVLEDEMEITSLNQASLPVAGTAASSFDYQNTYKIRAFIFSEEVIKKKIGESVAGEINDINFQPVAMALSYGESIPNYTENTLRLKAHASVTLESVIEKEKLAEEFLGKDEEGINAILAAHPEINKVQINIKPQWFSSAIPKSEDRVTILVDPGEE